MPLGNHRYGFESTLLMMRIVGWLESLAALEVLAFSVNHWSDVIDVVAAGIISVGSPLYAPLLGLAHRTDSSSPNRARF